MKVRRRIVWSTAAALTAASLAVGVGLAVGSGDAPTVAPTPADRQVSNQEVHPASPAVISAFSALSNPSPATAASPAEQNTLRNALGADAGADYGAIGNADFSMAQSAPIVGSSQRAWLVPSGDEACVVLPDPGDGFAATCQTLSAIRAGRGVLTVTPQPGSGDTTALVAVIVPDDGNSPSLETPNGAKTLAPSNNVAASVATTSDKLATAAGSLPLR